VIRETPKKKRESQRMKRGRVLKKKNRKKAKEIKNRNKENDQKTSSLKVTLSLRNFLSNR
jgi:hypothetical protein